MTDLLTENARLRAALAPFAKAGELFAGTKKDQTWTAVLYNPAAGKDYQITEDHVRAAYAALATPAPDAVQEAARVERVAFAMWKAEADRAAPNVGRNRTPEMFANELHDTRAKWLGLADAALRAIAGGRT